MIEPRSLPQIGLSSSNGSYGAGARSDRGNDSDLHARVFSTTVQFECVGEISDVCADGPNGTGMGLGK